MSWVTALWSLGAGISLSLAGLHLLIWFQNRRAWTSLVVVVLGLAALEHGATELAMMRATTPAEWGWALRWAHAGSFLSLAASSIFIQLYLGTGRLWLMWLTIGLRAVTLVMNFSLEPNLNFHAIHSLRSIPFLGETVSVLGDATVNPLMWFAQTTFLLWFIFVVDATIRLWRRGRTEDRRRALVVGGSTALFILTGAGEAVLSLNHVIDLPIVASMTILLMMVAMGNELSRDVLHSARLARDLSLTEHRLSLAASAANVILWEWRVDQDQLWSSTERIVPPSTLPPDRPLNIAQFAGILHPDDREPAMKLIHDAVDRSGSWSMEYRRVMRDGSIRWFAGRGAMERDSATGVRFMRGVSVDITERRKVDDELDRQRNELAHLSRVASLGELSGSLAHEINQPLAIILSNAQAAQRLLAQDPPDIVEVRQIVTDIINADKRAGEVIKRLRALLKHGETERRPLVLEDVVDEVLALTRSDFIARGILVVREKMPEPARVSGDHIALQQVLLNLFTNACDAMSANPLGARRLTIETAARRSLVLVSIRDTGCGLPPQSEKIFEPFFTTKAHGLGMGLPICRTIVAAHGGRLWAEPSATGGTIFHVELPLTPASS